MANIALDDVINVQVSAAAKANVKVGHNIGLIVGQSARIPVSKRCVAFANLDEMLAYGYQATDEEYKAAVLYFGQSAVPTKLIVGRMAPSDVTEAATATITGTGASAPTVALNTFRPAVSEKDGTYVFSYDGEAWSIGGKAISDLSAEYGITFTGSASEGQKINVVYVSGATEESWAAAIADCKAKNAEWYGVYCAYAAGMSADDSESVATYVESQRGCYFYDSADSTAITTADTDVFSVLKNGAYKRSCGIYSTTDYAGAAVMGYAMGGNTGAINSSYSLAYKALNGVKVDDLTVAEIGYLKSKNANYYIKRGGTYTVLEPGICSDGGWFDELIGVDQLTTDLQKACMDVLVSQGKVPYTDAGALQFVVACNEACNEAVNVGFLTPGVWQGGTVLGVQNGDTFETGYMVQVESVLNQSAEARASRICPPIYVCAILAGAIHSVTIKLDVE